MHKVYSKEGLYLEEQADGTVRIGLSSYGSDAVGEVSFFNDRELVAGEPFFSVEGSKAVTDMLAPISADIVSKNESLTDQPELLNEDDEILKWLVVTRSNHAIKWSEFLSEDQPIEN